MPRLREPPNKEPENKEEKALLAQKQQELEIKADPEPQDEDASEGAEELKRQIEVLRKSEEASRQRAEQANQEREKAILRANEREAELVKVQKTASSTRLDAINSAIAAANSEVESAKRDIRSATNEGDIEASITAQERLAEAKANLVALTNGKAAAEDEDKQTQAREAVKVEPRDALDQTNLPDTAKRWLRAHPDYLTDQRKNAKIQSLHWDVIDEGHPPFSDEYYVSMEQHLGMRSKPRQIAAEENDDDDRDGRSIVSAPVSREAPSSSKTPTRASDVRLTAAQREAAKLSGISETDYAKQLIILNQEKANGNYGGRP